MASMTQPIDLDELEREFRVVAHPELVAVRITTRIALFDRLRYLTAGLTEIRDGDHNKQQARVIADGLLSGTWNPTSHQEDA